MSDAHWEYVKRVVDEALQLRGSERVRHLDQACGADESLRREVDSLLEQETKGFLEQPISPDMSGRTISHYEFIEEIGRGGMGIVYRARDTKLKREVALKILPPGWVADPERKRRLILEARAAAALNHPNIAVIHEVGESDGVDFIAMELVVGDKLSELLDDGPLPVERAIAIGIDVAKGLSKAHAAGIVHRDLKPANLLISEDGSVKIIDFGIAKSVAPAVATSDVAETVTKTGYTREGQVLGTLNYMSPEQARGQSVDARSDLFSFGVVLYELLTGELLYREASGADVLDAILKDPVPSVRLATPAAEVLQKILNRCLEKDPDTRFQSASEVLEDLEDARAKSTRTMALTTRLVVAAVGVALVATVTWLVMERSPVSAIQLGNPVHVTTALGVEEDPTWSPDGSMLAFTGRFTASDAEPDSDIWVQQIDGGAPVNRTPDHDGPDAFPSWSPNGREIAFLSVRDDSAYYIMSSFGGPARKIRPLGNELGQWGSVTWSPDGTKLANVVYAEDRAGFVEIVPLDSNASRRVRLPGKTGGRGQLAWSPDERFIAYVDGHFRDAETQIWVLDLDSETAHAVTDGLSGAYSPRWLEDAQTIYFISNRSGPGDLWQQRLAADGRAVGPPSALTAGLGMRDSMAFAPDRRKLAYSRGRLTANIWRVPLLEDRVATWADAEQLTFGSTYVESLDLSADERSILLSSDRSGNLDLWVMPADGGEMVQITNEPGIDNGGRWSPDGKMIALYSSRGGNRDLWILPVEGGPARQLTTHPAPDWWPFWSADGGEIAFSSERDGDDDVWVTAANGGEPRRLMADRLGGLAPRYSPDGKLIAMLFRPGDGFFIRIVSLDGGDPLTISDIDAIQLAWAPDSSTIYFYDWDETHLAAVQIADPVVRRVVDLSGRPGAAGTFALEVGREHIYFVWDEDIGDIWVMDVERE